MHRTWCAVGDGTVAIWSDLSEKLERTCRVVSLQTAKATLQLGQILSQVVVTAKLEEGSRGCLVLGHIAEWMCWACHSGLTCGCQKWAEGNFWRSRRRFSLFPCPRACSSAGLVFCAPFFAGCKGGSGVLKILWAFGERDRAARKYHGRSGRRIGRNGNRMANPGEGSGVMEIFCPCGDRDRP